jgi:hypothetical protein
VTIVFVHHTFSMRNFKALFSSSPNSRNVIKPAPDVCLDDMISEAGPLPGCESTAAIAGYIEESDVVEGQVLGFSTDNSLFYAPPD